MPIFAPKDKKSELQAHKEKILQELKYYENRVEGFRATVSTKTYYEDESSSESDDGFQPTYNAGPTLLELKLQKSMLQTCLQATQELTSLQVAQSGVNVMVDDMVYNRIDGEPPVLEPGVWREVTADCRIDLVPFAIMFCVHKPHRKFAPSSYRCLRVLPVKNAHEAELSKSVLPGVTRPSDAIEVIRSYAEAYRSRRTTLARLADKYAHNLFMEPMAEGGYLLKCADLLEVSWRLENKWSPVAAFHHKMKFDLEYMDESYIKIITQAHKQLSDPSIETDERTLLLAKIITTCLEAQEPTQKLHESMESDPETKKLAKRRTTLDEEVEAPIPKKRREDTKKDVENRDDQIMAPPKSLPKKVKPKGKENTNDNRKSVKRASEDDNVRNAKVARNARESVSDLVEAMSKQNDKAKEAKSNDRNLTDGEKNYVVGQKKNDHNLNEKINAGTNLKNVDRETNDDEDAPNNGKKSKNKPDVNIPNVKDGNFDKQERTKKKTGKEQVEKPQKESKEKHIANAKNMPRTKEQAVEKVTGDDKSLASSKNELKNKNTNDKHQKEVTKDKMVAKSKNDLQTKAKVAVKATKTVASSENDLISENNPKVGSANAQNSETRTIISKQKASQNYKTHKDKNVDKKSAKDNVINEKVPKDKVSKIITDNEKTAEQNSEKVKNNNKTEANVKSVKPTVKNTENKDLNNKQKNLKDKTSKSNNDKNEQEKNAIGENVQQKYGNTQKELIINKKTKNVESQKKLQYNKDTNVKDKTSKSNKDENEKENHVDDKKEQQGSGNTLKELKTDKKTKIVESQKKIQNIKETNVEDKTTKRNKNINEEVKKADTNNEEVKSGSTQKELNSHKIHMKNVESQNNVQKAISNSKSSNKIKEDKNVKAIATEKTKSNVNQQHIDVTKKNTESNTKKNKGDVIVKSVKVKNVANRNKEYVSNIIDDNNENISKEKLTKKMVIKHLSHNNPHAQKKLPKKTTNPSEAKAVNSARTSNTVKILKTGNTGKENVNGKTSKIPQKRMSFSDSAMPRNRLRISPRKLPSTFKSISDSNLKRKIQPTTNIPRLVKNSK